MKTKNISIFSLLLLTAFSLAMDIPSADAFWGGKGKMPEEHFTALKQIISQSSTSEEFRTAWEQKRLAWQKERQEKMNVSVENIENGVVKKITSTDSELVKQIQDRHKDMKEPIGKGRGLNKNTSVTRTVENIADGVKITLTSTDPETVKWLQTKKEFEKDMKGLGKFGKMKGHQKRYQ